MSAYIQRCPNCGALPEHQSEPPVREPDWEVFYEWVAENMALVVELCPYKFRRASSSAIGSHETPGICDHIWKPLLDGENWACVKCGHIRPGPSPASASGFSSPPTSAGVASQVTRGGAEAEESSPAREFISDSPETSETSIPPTKAER